jgi:hypothetical protein
LPVDSLQDCIADGSNTVTPIKTAVAIFRERPLSGIEPLDVADHGKDALREFRCDA